MALFTAGDSFPYLPWQRQPAPGQSVAVGALLWSETCFFTASHAGGRCEFMLIEIASFLRTKSWQRTDSFCHEAFSVLFSASKSFNGGGFLTLD